MRSLRRGRDQFKIRSTVIGGIPRPETRGAERGNPAGVVFVKRNRPRSPTPRNGCQASDIAEALTAQTETLVRDLFPAGRRQGNDWCVGSLAGEPGQSLRIGLAGKHRGRWQEFADGTGGDMLDLVAAVNFGPDLRQAIDWARAWLGQATISPTPPTRDASTAQPARYSSLSRFGRELWASCRPIDAESAAGLYLATRGCSLPHPEGDLRWHPALKHPGGHVGPALVALVTDVHAADRWLTIHRTWIQADGRKAEIETPRLLLAGHPKAGGVIRLWPDDSVATGLGIAEGIETALAAAKRFTPVWAAIDAGNLGAFPVLGGIEALTIVVDHDRAGVNSALNLGRRWRQAGREVFVLYPEKPGTDWCDVESVRWRPASE